MSTLSLLTTVQMRAVESQVFESGRQSSLQAMNRAGEAVAQAVLERWAETGRAVVLCGPGNNGGDGYVVARCLLAADWDVQVVASDQAAPATGDAAHMKKVWHDACARYTCGTVGPGREESAAQLLAETGVPERPVVVVDALFGIGLSRDIAAADLIALVTLVRRWRDAGRTKVVAVDLPTGVHADSGAIMGVAMVADLTLTFGSRKPAHLLHPGAALCGEVICAPVGLDQASNMDIWPCQTMLATGRPVVCGMTPSATHKYARGHVFIHSGPAHRTGAARLAARAAARSGMAGAVTMLAPEQSVQVLAGHLTSIMIEPIGAAADLHGLLPGGRPSALVIGPAAGVSEETRALVLAALATAVPLVLDADALSVFAGNTDVLAAAIADRAPGAPTVLTPHEGEFARLFGGIDPALDKPTRARLAAQMSGAIVLLKGPDTVIATPQGQCWINGHASPYLATAGSGDVLAGLIGAALAGPHLPVRLAAAGAAAPGPVPADERVALAAWLHGEAGRRCGIGLIAEDLPEELPAIMAAIMAGEE